MSINIECEERVMIDENQYENISHDLLLAFPSHYPFDITNEYLDTSEFLLRNNHTILRIRHISTQKEYELTIKVKGHDGDKEITTLINEKERKDFLIHHQLKDSDVKEYLNSHDIDITSLNVWASLKTHRLEIKRPDYLIVLDRNEYHDIIDYDLEIESVSLKTAKEIILSLCQKYHIEYKDDYMSKSSRVFHALH